jgi:hypothetical protein
MRIFLDDVEPYEYARYLDTVHPFSSDAYD